jgi:BMFP domain-containing protein YqiC
MSFFKKIFGWIPFGKKKDDQKVKGERPKSEDDLKEYTFIWYKQMEIGNKIQYTPPNRTKVKARNREEAVEKMKNFAMRKMTLVIREEKDYDSSDLGKINAEFEKLNNYMENIFSKFKKK